MLDRNFFDSISDVVIIVDENSLIIDVSLSVVDVFLYSKEELIGQPIEILLPERYRAGHKAMFDRYVKNPSPRRMGSERKLFGLDKNAHEFSVDIALSLFKKNGRDFFAAIIRDVSDFIGYQNKLESLNNELRAKNKALDEFAYMVAHDLKSPANAIIGLVDLIRHDHKEELNPDVMQCFMYIEQSSKRMTKLIDGVLNYTRAGEVDTRISGFKLKGLIQEVINNLDVPVGFKTKIKCADIELHTNKVQLSQILSNLIGNAIKYHDKKTGNITITCKKTNKELEISVKDDGPGIQEKYHSTIFELFGTANLHNRADSTGIGLSIVKKLIEQNGGAIRVNSAKGKSTEFIFTWITREPF